MPDHTTDDTDDPTPGTVPVHLRLPEPVAEALRVAAHDRGQPLSDIAARALVEHLPAEYFDGDGRADLAARLDANPPH